MTQDEAREATRNYFLSRHPMRIRGRSMNQEEVFDIRFDSFNAGFDAGYEAAVTAERERIVAELETQIQIASYGGSNYREIARTVLEKAIEIVKGSNGDE